MPATMSSRAMGVAVHGSGSMWPVQRGHSVATPNALAGSLPPMMARVSDIDQYLVLAVLQPSGPSGPENTSPGRLPVRRRYYSTPTNVSRVVTNCSEMQPALQAGLFLQAKPTAEYPLLTVVLVQGRKH
jgi:hypothetical protein